MEAQLADPDFAGLDDVDDLDAHLAAVERERADVARYLGGAEPSGPSANIRS